MTNRQKQGRVRERKADWRVVARLTAQVEDLTRRTTELLEHSGPAAVLALKRSVGELAARFDGMEGTTRQAVDELERERQALVSALANDERVPFSAAELETKPIAELRKLREVMAYGWWPYEWVVVRTDRRREWKRAQQIAARTARRSGRRNQPKKGRRT